MEYYSDLNALPRNPSFEIEFKCKNCGKEFTRRFDSDVRVEPAGVNRPNFIGINEVSGNRYVVVIDGEKFTLQCDNCDIHTSLYVLNREPLGDRTTRGADMTNRQEVTVTLMPDTVEQIEEVRDMAREQDESNGRGSRGMVVDLAVKYYKQSIKNGNVWG